MDRMVPSSSWWCVAAASPRAKLTPARAFAAAAASAWLSSGTGASAAPSVALYCSGIGAHIIDCFRRFQLRSLAAAALTIPPPSAGASDSKMLSKSMPPKNSSARTPDRHATA